MSFIVVLFIVGLNLTGYSLFFQDGFYPILKNRRLYIVLVVMIVGSLVSSYSNQSDIFRISYSLFFFYLISIFLYKVLLRFLDLSDESIKRFHWVGKYVVLSLMTLLTTTAQILLISGIIN